MNALVSTCIVFACICAGIFIGALLPGHRMANETKDVVRLGTGLIGTMAALVLGLLIGSAKQSYDFKIGEISNSRPILFFLTSFSCSTARTLMTQGSPYGKLFLR